jgi:hypothetical protein
VAHLLEQSFLTRRSIRYQMMERLMRRPHMVRTELCRHGFEARAFPGQKQTLTIRFERFHAIGVLCGLRQAIEIGREALLLRAWCRSTGAPADRVQGERSNRC